MRIPAKYIVLIIIFITQNACSEGSGNDASLAGSTAQSLLRGKIVTEYLGQMWMVDLPSGSYSRYDTPKWGDDDTYNGSATFAFSAKGFEDNGFTYAVRNCLQSDSSTSCIVLLDNKFGLENRYFYDGSITGRVKVSRDGKYIASARTTDMGVQILLNSGTGDFLDLHEISVSNRIVLMDWHPDGRLFISVPGTRSLLVTNAGQIKPEFEFSLPDDYQGTFYDIAISPDGRFLAFELETGDSVLGYGVTVAVMDLTDLSLRRLVKDAHTDNPNDTKIQRPRWSPDGRWILVTYGGGSFDNVVATSPYLFAVPSNGIEVPLAPFDSTVQTSAIQISTDARTTIGTSEAQADKWYGDDFYWLNSGDSLLN